MTNVLPLTRSWFLLLRNQLSFVPHFNPQIFILHLTFIFSPSDINSSQHCNETLKFHALYSTALRPPSSLKFNLCPSSWQFLLLDLPLLLNIPEPRYLIWNVSPHILLHDNSLATNLGILHLSRIFLSFPLPNLGFCSSNPVTWHLVNSLWLLNLSSRHVARCQ